ncbi:unnamed protein product [Leuciscus chuanchicus]
MKIYCNSKGESSALVSTLTLSPPEVPDLAFTPVSHLLLKAIGTSSHLPHYGVNVRGNPYSRHSVREHVVRVRPSKHLQKRARRYANEAPFSLLTFFTLSVAPRISVASRPYLLSFARQSETPHSPSFSFSHFAIDIQRLVKRSESTAND